MKGSERRLLKKWRRAALCSFSMRREPYLGLKVTGMLLMMLTYSFRNPAKFPSSSSLNLNSSSLFK